MPWSNNDYPDSMKNLQDDVREKAIDIANALLEEDYDEGRAISIGIAQARKYMDGDEHRTEYHIQPDEEEWILTRQHTGKAIMREDTKEDLLETAKEYVNEHDGILVIHKLDGSVSDRLYE
ncbi:DUF2188 domain-containing protein [Siminovitchia sediminis]|uniref:DUF2188 domain-containing protein n=1 Tax=Siminovitchia sediminis TaxID=1274353 RepID=A0ABW4KKY3_9BACI